MKNDDLASGLEDAQHELKVSGSQVFSQMKKSQVQSGEKKIIDLMRELQKLKQTSENEFKKLRKAQQNTVGSGTNNLTTGGSGDGTLPKLSYSISLDPYASGTLKQGADLNQTMVECADSPFGPIQNS